MRLATLAALLPLAAAFVQLAPPGGDAAAAVAKRDSVSADPALAAAEEDDQDLDPDLDLDLDEDTPPTNLGERDGLGDAWPAAGLDRREPQPLLTPPPSGWKPKPHKCSDGKYRVICKKDSGPRRAHRRAEAQGDGGAETCCDIKTGRCTSTDRICTDASAAAGTRRLSRRHNKKPGQHHAHRPHLCCDGTTQTKCTAAHNHSVKAGKTCPGATQPGVPSPK